MNVAVTAGALAWRSAIRSSSTAQPVLFRRVVAAVTGGVCVHAGQGPDAVIDSGRFPASLRMAMGAASVAHFCRELVAVRVVMTTSAAPRLQSETISWTFASVTARAWDRLMLALQGEIGSAVLLHGEQSGPEPLLVMAARTIRRSEPSPMHIAMAVPTLLKAKIPVSPLQGQLGGVATRARDLPVPAFEWKGGKRMGTKSDLSWEPRPANAGMTTLTAIAEFCFMHLSMTGNALRAGTRRFDVALVVATFALRLGVTSRKAQDRMILPDVGDFAPVRLVVTRDALGPFEAAFVGIVMAGNAVGL